MSTSDYRRKKKRQRRIIYRVLALCVSALMIFLTVLLIRYSKKMGSGTPTPMPSVTPEVITGEPTKVPDPTPTPIPLLEIAFTEEHAHAGESVEEISKGTNFSYAVRYPKCEDEVMKESVERTFKKIFDRETEELSANRMSECRLWIDYEEGTCKELTSIVYFITTEVNGEKSGRHEIYIYNRKEKERESADNLFSDLAYAYVADKINTELGLTAETGALKGVKSEFQYFLFYEDGISFFYDKGAVRGEEKIPFYEIHTYMAVTVDGGVRIQRIRTNLDPNKPMIALTFDDGPNYLTTPHLIEVLKENNARATFFVIGDRANWKENEGIVRLAAEAGNEIGSHTYSHSNLSKLSEEKIDEELAKTRELIYQMTGYYPTFVRAPGGNLSDTVKARAFAPLVNWSIDTRDWETKDTPSIIQEMNKGKKNNRISLMHDIYKASLDAATELIPQLISEGYQLVTLSELFYYRNIQVKNGTLYRSAE